MKRGRIGVFDESSSSDENPQINDFSIDFSSLLNIIVPYITSLRGFPDPKLAKQILHDIKLEKHRKTIRDNLGDSPAVQGLIREIEREIEKVKKEAAEKRTKQEKNHQSTEENNDKDGENQLLQAKKKSRWDTGATETPQPVQSANLVVATKQEAEQILAAPVTKIVTTLKVNENLQPSKIAKKQQKLFEQQQLDAELNQGPENPYFEPELVKKTEAKTRRTFNFVPEGKYKDAGDRFRARLVFSQMLEEKKHIETQEAKLKTIQDALNLVRASVLKMTVPAVEWWDLPFILAENPAGYPDHFNAETLNEKRITDLVQHPVPLIRATLQNAQPPPPPELKLTSKEIHKMRRQRREEQQKEEQKKIQLGLIPAPAPRVTMSNYIRVLGSQAFADPTAAEHMAKKQVQERFEKHIETNEARKLTPEERKAKLARAFDRDRAKGLKLEVFVISNLDNRSHVVKLTESARKWKLGGTVLPISRGYMLVVEGGQRALNKYNALLLRRIRWNEAPRQPIAAEGKGDDAGDSNDDDDGESNDGDDHDDEMNGRHAADDADMHSTSAGAGDDIGENRCVKVWSGLSVDAFFRVFRADLTTPRDETKNILSRHKCEHLLEIAENFEKLED